MSAKMRIVVIALLLAGAAVAASLVFAAPSAKPADSRAAREAERARHQQELLQRSLDTMELTDAEKAATTTALQAKNEARTVLARELSHLRTVTVKGKVSEAELRIAITNYYNALADYRALVAAQDKALSAKLSVAARARCLTMGVLDNGLMGPNRMGFSGSGLMRRSMQEHEAGIAPGTPPPARH